MGSAVKNWQPPPRFKNKHNYPVTVTPDAKRADPNKSVPRMVDVPPNGFVVGAEYAQCVGEKSIIPFPWTPGEVAAAIKRGDLTVPEGVQLAPEHDPKHPSSAPSPASSAAVGREPNEVGGMNRQQWLQEIESRSPDVLAQQLGAEKLYKLAQWLKAPVSSRDAVGIAAELWQWVAVLRQQDDRH